MTDGRSQAPQTPPIIVAAKGVNNFAAPTIAAEGNDQHIVARLTELAPLHRKAALRRALAEARLPDTYVIPSGSELSTAEHPPEPVYDEEVIHRGPQPSKTDVERTAQALLRDTDWLDTAPVGQPKLRRRLAAEEAEKHLWREWHSTPAQRVVRRVLNPDEVAHGRAMAALHGPLLGGLATVLDGLDDVIPRSRLAAMTDSDIKMLAEEYAADARGHWRWRTSAAVRAGRPLLEATPDDMRRMCPRWHTRQLRRQAGMARQHLAAALGTVGRGGAPYADDYSLSRWKEVQASAEEWAANRVLMSPDGRNSISMAAVVRDGRMAALTRLRTITRGLDELGERRGLKAIMVTLTLPPEWHPNPAKGNKSWTTEKGPKETDAALRALWTRFRARLAKSKIRLLGLRVVEPHKDGTPHIHALLYVEEGGIRVIDGHLKDLCPESARRRGKRVASDLKRINRRRGRGSTYIMKYLQKALAAGAGADSAPRSEDDDEGDDHLAHYERHRAIASERGWRRYALLGVHGIGRVWQRLYTATPDELEQAPAIVREVTKAMQESRWADALELLGAIRERGQRPSIRLAYEERETAYGDFSKRAVALESEDDWSLPLSKGWTTELVETQVSSEVGRSNNEVTLITRFPRAAAAPSTRRPRAADVYEATILPLIALRSGDPTWTEWIRQRQERLTAMRTDEADDDESLAVAA